MNIAIIDADLLGRTKHRFPNLVCGKLSAYWKEQGANVELFLYMLSDSTYLRRRSNIKSVLNVLVKSEENDFTDFIELIRL